MQLYVFYYYSKCKGVSKFEVHMSSKILQGMQTSIYDLSYMKLVEWYINLWTTYGHTLSKLFKTLIKSLWT
jgi:hypothetical protein